MQESSPAPREPLLASKFQANEITSEGPASGVSLSMARHGDSKMEGRGIALLQVDESETGTGREAHPAPSNGRPPRLPTLGLEPGRSRRTSSLIALSLIGPGPKVISVGRVVMEPGEKPGSCSRSNQR